MVRDTTVSYEFWLCHIEMGFKLQDMKQQIVSAFKSSFTSSRNIYGRELRFQDGTIDGAPNAHARKDGRTVDTRANADTPKPAATV